MEKITVASPEAQSADLVAGNIDQLKALFPDLITEGPNGKAVNVDVLKALVGDQVMKSERCCGESGTLGVTRPDISTQIRFRKTEEIRKGEAALRESGQVGAKDNVKVLTSCPSCLQGLNRYQDDLQNGLLEADYIVVEMAREILGENWMPEYVQRANNGGIERVLV